jgi:hypothetical protein
MKVDAYIILGQSAPTQGRRKLYRTGAKATSFANANLESGTSHILDAPHLKKVPPLAEIFGFFA